MMSIRKMMTCVVFGPLVSHLGSPSFPGDISIVRDFFGYTQVPDGVRLSVRKQMRLLKGKHINLNLIRVGIENFTNEHEREIDYAVHVMRDIYATVNIGVGRLERHYITEAAANEVGIHMSTLDWDADAVDLTDEFTVDNTDALDIFFLLAWDLFQNGQAGRSAVDGSCNKFIPINLTGCIVSLEVSPTNTGTLLAHEVGHYLGLEHIVDLESEEVQGMDFPDILDHNVMFPDTSAHTDQLLPYQGWEMKDHCFIIPGC